MDKFFINSKGQAQPKGIRRLSPKDFENGGHVGIYWLGGGGAMINACGTVILIDPVLEGFDMKMLIDAPVRACDIPNVDACLISHVDSDHYSRDTLKKLSNVTGEAHASRYVASLIREECGVNAFGHTWNDEVAINDVKVRFTPADHNWQNGVEAFGYRTWAKQDCNGFYITARGIKIWFPGDSRLMEEQLHLEAPDVILFDFSDDSWHIGLENAYKLANAYPNAELIPIHWGTVDAPDMPPFNANPQNVIDNVLNPDRVRILLPGEEYAVG